MRRVEHVLLSLVALVLLTSCASRTAKQATTVTSTNTMAQSSSTWTVDSAPPATSTVAAPKLPKFPPRYSFVVDFNGNGKAAARFVAPPPNPAQKRWHRVARFIVEPGIVDGIWVDDLTFEGRLGDDTIVTTTEQVALGSNKLVKVSRRVRDILRDDPRWKGLEDGTRVSVTFARKKGTGPVDVLTLAALDPIRKTVRLLDPGPHYTMSTASDPIVRDALIKLNGTKGSIVGYLLDYGDWTTREGPVVELVVDKGGNLFHTVEGYWRPLSAFGGKAQPRAQPESDREATIRKTAVAHGEDTAGLSPLLPKATGVVYSYVVRVVREDGSSVDVLVGNDGRLSDTPDEVKLQPWGPPTR